MCNICNEGVNKEQDHRYLGKKLSYFTFDEIIGAGMPIWLEKGNTTKEIISNYINKLQRSFGIQLVKTPVFGTEDLYKKSGHLDHYSENMFPAITLENKNFVLRPMTCPHHILLLKQQVLTHKSFPIAIGENALLFRNEYSGGLIGLERVRLMELIDTHIFVLQDQIDLEIEKACQLIFKVIETFQIELDSITLSVRDPANPEKFFDDPSMWDDSEEKLNKIITKVLSDTEMPLLQGVKYEKDIGGAAFYGPKIDFQINTNNNKSITMSTIQLDFLLSKRFELTYHDIDQNPQHPVIIHLGIIGTLERFMAHILEKHSGNLPCWLTPIQVSIIPINNDLHLPTCEKLHKLFAKAQVRSTIATGNQRSAKKISLSQQQKIPYQILIGDEETKSLDNLVYKQLGEATPTKTTLNEFVELIQSFNSVLED